MRVEPSPMVVTSTVSLAVTVPGSVTGGASSTGGVAPVLSVGKVASSVGAVVFVSSFGVSAGGVHPVRAIPAARIPAMARGRVLRSMFSPLCVFSVSVVFVAYELCMTVL